MPSISDDVYVRNLKSSNAIKNEDFIVGETKTGTKLFPVEEFKNYIYSCMCAETVNDMKNMNFHSGDLCYTHGYREMNDGGGGMYVVVYDPTSVEDKGFTITINTNDTLRANLLSRNNFVNVHQFGAYGDGVHDDTKFIQNALNTGMNVVFTSGKVYKITSSLKIKKSNQVIDMNYGTIVPYNCFAFTIDGDDSSYIENVTFNNTNIRCANNANGVKIGLYVKNIKFENFNIISLKSNSKAFVVEGSEKIIFSNGNIYGNDYQGDVFILKSLSTENANRNIVISDVHAYNCGVFCDIDFKNEVTDLLVENCSFMNDEIPNNNVPYAFYIDGEYRRIEIKKFNCQNLDTFLFTTSQTKGIITIEDLFANDVLSIYKLNSSYIQSSIQFKGIHKYIGTNREPKNCVFASMYSNLYNNASIEYDETVYDMIKYALECCGRLIDHHLPDVVEEKEYVNSSNTTLNVDAPNNARYNWTGDLLLKNINGFEGQIIYVRSTTGQEISSGGNIVLYPDTPDISFKEAMTSTPFKFRCENGKWIKFD